MVSENENSATTEIEPNLQQARSVSVMAHSVLIRLREMGLPSELDAELASLCTDLGDLWGAQKDFAKQLESFVKSAHDWDAVGDHLVDMRASIDHIEWHLKSVQEPLEKVAEYAYEQESE